MVPILPISERQTVHCPHCKLNQFVTASNRCRRCRLSLDSSVDPEPEQMRLVPGAAAHNWQRDMPWGVLLHEMRVAAGLSQVQLANKIRGQRTFISKLEARQSPPHFQTVLKLACALNVPESVLVDNAEMARELCEQAILRDEFLVQILDVVRGLDAHVLQLMIDAVTDLLRHQQYTILEWSQVGPTQREFETK
jgi:transcriptional regulator with XRE-family HTH domain